MGGRLPKRGRMHMAVMIALGVLAGITLALVTGQILSRRSLRAEVRTLFAASGGGRELIRESALQGLPEPVQRWLRHANVVGSERIRTVRLMQAGTFRLAPDAKWMRFVAEEYYTTDPPAFLWRASFRLSFIPFLEVRDVYVGGKGRTSIRLASLITAGGEAGPEADQGDLLRYLNEIMWFPAAALSDYITWSPRDAGSAKATMRYRGVSASAVFHFDEAGRLIDMVAERYGKFGDHYALETWSTPINQYGAFNGIRVPTGGEGVWKLASGDFSYIHLEVGDIEYNVRDPY